MVPTEANRLRITLQCLQAADEGQPFALHLAGWCRQHRNMGSRDRRQLADACFAALRCGNALPHHSPELQVMAGLLLKHQSPDPLAVYIATSLKLPLHNHLFAASFHEKVSWLESETGFDLAAMFPLHLEVSKRFPLPEFLSELHKTPAVFAWMKPGTEAETMAGLSNAGITFEGIPSVSGCLTFSAGIHLDKLPPRLRNNLQVQDLSSQFSTTVMQALPGQNWWDCCAASGGKSLLLTKVQPAINLFVSDVRPASLQQLQHRFAAWGLLQPQQAVIDLEKPLPPVLPFNHEQAGNDFFDGILLDAPCSGSGTWRRQPEWLSRFTPDLLHQCVQRQSSIARRILPYLKPGGHLLYITCSVYATENEKQVHHLTETNPFKLLQDAYLDASRQGGDCLYVALLEKQ